VAPEITSACRHWYTNDGDGLDAAGALALAEALEQEINTSRIHAHARRYAAEQELIAAEQELMPDKLCVSCGGSGLRKSAHARLHGGGVLKPGMIICNQCEGAGYVRPITGCLEFTTENVAAFVAFLRECGGFEIC
jgi:hypothetical protein